MGTRYLSSKRHFYFCCIFFFAVNTVYPQYDYGKIPLFMQAAVHTGRVIPNGDAYNYLWDIHMYGVEISLGKQTYGKMEWEKHAKYPRYGFTFRYLDFDYENFEKSLALFAFFEGTILRHQFFSLNYGLGTGLIFWPNHYDKVKNPSNIFIGSKLNTHIDLTLSADFMLSKSSNLFVKANFTHSSNGALVLPNKGVNGISAGIGFRYHFFQRPPFLPLCDTLSRFTPQNILYISIMSGMRQSDINYRYCYKQSIQIGYARQFHPLFRYGGGLDINYSADLLSLLPRDKKNVINCMNTAVYLAFDVIFGRLNFHGAAGCYLYRGFDYYTMIYERVGVRFFLDRQLNHYLGVAIKAHGGKADYIEWTYGFSVFNKLSRPDKSLPPF